MYQVIVSPGPPVAVAFNLCVVVPSVQASTLFAVGGVGALGAAFIVTVTGVLVTLQQVPLKDYA